MIRYTIHTFVPFPKQEQLSDRSRAYIRRCVRITAQLTATEQVDIRNVQVTEPGGDRSVCHFLELLTTQRMHEQ